MGVEDISFIRDITHMIEKNHGRRCACIFVDLLALAIVGFILKYAYEWYISPFFNWVSDKFKGEPFINQDDVVPFFVTLVFTGISIFILAGVLTIIKYLRKRVIPQSVIDEIAGLRSVGVSIYAEQLVADAFPSWKQRWEKWRGEVEAALGDKFSKAEELSFSRLGVIEPTNFAHAVTAEHEHKLMMLKKQLTILEDLISRHLDKQ